MKSSDIRDLVTSHFSKPLVAVFIGGTQGIGHFTLSVLSKVCATNKVSLTAYVVGRSAEKAEGVLSECSRNHPEGQFTFVQAKDLTSIIDVDKVSNEILDLERSKGGDARIDLLVLTQGQVLFGGRKETPEGLDRSMALLYYSRIRFINNFMPLLEASSSPHVISVYAAGMESTLHREDLSLRKPGNYTFANCRSHCVHMKTMAFESLAKEHPKLSLAHIYPGLVVGPGFYDSELPTWFKILWFVMRPLAELLSTTPEDAGFIMLMAGTGFCPAKESGDEGQMRYAGTDGVKGSGAYTVGRKGDELQGKAERKMLRSSGFQEQVWEHTTKVLDDVVKQGKSLD